MSHYKLKGTSGSVINQSFPFAESILLGSSPECDIRMEEPGVSSRHAEIRLVDGKSLLLKDLGTTNGTLLNGIAVTEALLGSGDEIRIGTCRWMLQAPGLRPERILTGDVVSKPARRWPGVLIWTGVLTAAAAVAVLMWKPEWLEYLRSLL
ncbi:MAG: FHA domain-containing protein [Lysobacterales bacterium]